MGGVIGIVADGVFPEAALPDAAFGFGGAACGAGFGFWDGSGEFGFDDLPACGEIGVAFGQGPEAVRVVGQDDPGVDVKGQPGAGFANCGAEGGDVFGEKGLPAVVQVDREEIRCLRGRGCGGNRS
jgi:hypothetical protein